MDTLQIQWELMEQSLHNTDGLLLFKHPVGICGYTRSLHGGVSNTNSGRDVIHQKSQEPNHQYLLPSVWELLIEK